MIISGRNNVKEILKNFSPYFEIKKAICQDNFNENDILSLIEMNKIPTIYKKKQELDALAKNNHQGVILEVRDFSYTNLDDIIKNKDKCFIVILDHLEDPHNLGAIIRTCETAGVDGIVLPLNRSVSVTDTVVKTSVGAVFHTNISQVTNLNSTIKFLKENGFWIVGTDMDGELYTNIKYPNKCALVIGSEGFGMSRIVKQSCDYIARIPVNGKVNSLNASVAAGILIYEVIKR